MLRSAKTIVPAAALILIACGGGESTAPENTTVVTCAPTDPVCPVGSSTLGFTGVSGSPSIASSSQNTVASTSSSHTVSGTTNATNNGHWLIIINDQLRAWGVLGLSSGTWSAQVPLFCGTQQVTYTFATGNARSYYRTNVTYSACTTAQLRVQLAWDSGPDSDIDLHLLRPNGTIGGANDCYFSNCRGVGLEWGASGSAGNPVLDVDDTQGWGPENIVIASGAEAGDYRIIVHNFDGSAATSATVKVYLNEVEQQRFTSLTLDAGSRGYWQVARVNVVTGQVTAVNTYSATAPAFVAVAYRK